MPFNITDFKSQFEKHGGPAMSNLFEVQLLGLPKGIVVNKNYDPTRGFTFFCHKMDIPAVAINSSDIAYTGQMKRKLPTAVQNPGPMTGSFFVDSNHHVLAFFHQWAQTIVNYSKGNDPTAEVNGKLPHEVGFKKDFSCDMVIKHYSTDSYPDSYYEAKLFGVWPVSIGALNLDWTGGTALSLDVQFTMSDIGFSSDRTGTKDGLSRGGGLLDVLGDIAGFADTVRGTLKGGKPTSIQDAVNRLDRLGNAIDNLGG